MTILISPERRVKGRRYEAGQGTPGPLCSFHEFVGRTAQIPRDSDIARSGRGIAAAAGTRRSNKVLDRAKFSAGLSKWRDLERHCRGDALCSPQQSKVHQDAIPPDDPQR
jgi:hypothetical protein